MIAGTGSTTPVSGLRVVVTGKIDGESRSTAEAKLRDAGAIVQSQVTGETDLLVTGAKVGSTKMRQAEALGVTVVPWERAFGPVPAAHTPVRALAENGVLSVRTVAPMLAKAGELPSGDRWLFEVKWDGYRGIATVKDGKVALQSRSGKSDYVEQFPEVVRELATFPDCVLDGELVVLDENGNSCFESMDSKGQASFVVFDVLELLANDVRALPLRDRRSLLEELPWCTRITLSPVFDDGELLMEFIAQRKLEGIVAKRRDSAYLEGTRTEAWTKVKIRNEQEFVALGWLPGEGSMAGAAGSLVIATYDEEAGRYVCCGRVGSGREYELWRSFTERTPRRWSSDELDLNGYVPPAGAVWVEPFVVQVRFQRWTADRRLWHPSLQGVRTDKQPTEVRRES